MPEEAVETVEPTEEEAPQETQVEETPSPEAAEAAEDDFEAPVEMPDFIADAGLEPPPPPDIPAPPPQTGPPTPSGRPLPAGIPTEEEWVADYAGSVQRMKAAIEAPLREELDSLKQGTGHRAYMEFKQASNEATRGVRKAYSDVMSLSKAYRTNEGVKQATDGFIAAYIAEARRHGDTVALKDISSNPEGFVRRALGMQCAEKGVDIEWIKPSTDSVTVRGGKQAGAGGPRAVESENHGLTKDEMDMADEYGYSYKEIAEQKKRRGETGE